VVCPKGTRTFSVTHPDHLDRTWLVSAPSWGDQEVGTCELSPVPTGGGLWLASDDGFTALPQAPIVRRTGPDEQRWCVDAAAGDPVPVGAGAVRLLDNHVADWRIFKLDAEGCAYRTQRTAGSTWSFSADRVTPEALTERGPGRSWVDLELQPGDYVIAEWYEGFLVEGDEDHWRGHWLRAGTAARPPATAPEVAPAPGGG
jgi:hypothetical protein